MPRRRKRGAGLMIPLVGGVLLLGSLAIASVLRPPPGAQGAVAVCDPKEPGRTTVVLVDGSNALAPRSAATVRQLVHDAMDGRRGARVILARVSGDARYQPEILADLCDPGGAEDARFNEGPVTRADLRQTAFFDPIDQAIAKLVTPVSSSDKSYLSDAISRAAADPAMHLRDPGATLVFASDLIENSDFSRPYETGGIVLPQVRERFLEGIAVKLVELPAMPGAEMLQTYEMRDRWRKWLLAAGARDVQQLSPGLRRS